MSCITLNNMQPDQCRAVTGYKVGGLISDEPFSFSVADLNDEAAIKAKIIASAGRIYPLIAPEFFESVAQREFTTQETTNGITKNVGTSGHSFRVMEDTPSWFAIQKELMDGINSADLYVLLITSNGYYEGNSSGDYSTVEARRFNVAKNVMEAEDNATTQKLAWTFAELEPAINVAEMYFAKPTTYSPLKLKGITDVLVEQNSGTATEIVLTISRPSRSGSSPTQLAVDNFELLDGVGAPQTINTVTYASGKYTLAGTAFVAGTIQVKPVVGDTLYYESAQIAITIT